MIDFVRSCWSTVLGHNEFEDDVAFFNAGGNSIQLMKLRSLYTTSNYNVSIIELFQHLTVSEHAKLLEKTA